MKCKFCGAEIEPGSNVCKYCDSEIERVISEVQTPVRDDKDSLKSILIVIGKVIVALACVGAVLLVVTMIVVLNSDAFKNTYRYSSNTNASLDIPKNETELTGKIISCDQKGVASILYQGHTYENIKILDKALIDWLNDTDRTIDGVEIRFATDAEGNVSELGLLSANFFIVSQNENHYFAIREGQVISFTALTPLKTDHYYSGYFSYPDLSLYWCEETHLLALTSMDPKCTDKKCSTEQEYYTGADITVYQVYVNHRWYYCSQETYDAIQIDDLLKDYTLYTDEDMAFIVR